MTRRVLLIEDDESLRQVLAINLEDLGFRVDEAAGGRAGLKAFDPERHGVVLTDLRMPEVDGMEVLRGVLARAPSATVIVMTAYGGTERALEAVRRGAFHFVEKPVNTAALGAELRRALAASGGAEPETLRAPRASDLVASSPAMNRTLRVVDKVAGRDVPVLITGESGVGKELIARASHERSARSSAPFVAINCAAIPADLLESTLFGHEAGAFTGAVSRAEGKFRAADGGTLFLDEIAEMPLSIQPKLLRALQGGQIERVGAARGEQVDVRIVAATHRDLRREIERESFRADLYYRLYVVPIEVPPLRERPADIPVLARHFLRRATPGDAVSIAPELDRALIAYAWPGNVRELGNAIERMVILREADELSLADLPAEIGASIAAEAPNDRDALPFALPDGGLDLMDLERRVIVAALARCGGNRSATARYLRVPRHVLVYRMQKFSIEAPPRASADRQ